MAAATSLPEAIRTLRECKIDGRAQYFRYRQRQILGLYNSLSSNHADVVRAIQADTGKLPFEAELEITLVLRQLRKQFDEATFETMTKRVETLRKSGSVSTGFGMALIVGHQTAPLETVISPLAAAIIAGNVALCLVPPSSKSLLETLQRILYPSIDGNAYLLFPATEEHISTSMDTPFDVYSAVTTDTKLRDRISSTAQSREAVCHLLPRSVQPNKQNFAIVSKTAPREDLERIAKLLVRSAFFSGSGAGLGRISVACVHEQVHNELVKHAVISARECATDLREMQAPPLSLASASTGEGKIVFGGDGNSPAAIVEKVSASAEVLNKPIQGPVLFLVPYTSTEEAINIIAPRCGQVLSIFANQLEINYFVDDTRPYAVTANDVPLELLVGIAPSHDDAPEIRWPSQFFERQIRIVQRNSSLAQVFPPFADWQIEAMKKALLPGFVSALRLKLKPHSNIVGRVFFLQGLFLSVSLVLGTIATVTGFGGYRLYRYLMMR